MTVSIGTDRSAMEGSSPSSGDTIRNSAPPRLGTNVEPDDGPVHALSRATRYPAEQALEDVRFATSLQPTFDADMSRFPLQHWERAPSATRGRTLLCRSAPGGSCRMVASKYLRDLRCQDGTQASRFAEWDDLEPGLFVRSWLFLCRGSTARPRAGRVTLLWALVVQGLWKPLSAFLVARPAKPRAAWSECDRGEGGPVLWVRKRRDPGLRSPWVSWLSRAVISHRVGDRQGIDKTSRMSEERVSDLGIEPTVRQGRNCGVSPRGKDHSRICRMDARALEPSVRRDLGWSERELHRRDGQSDTGGTASRSFGPALGERLVRAAEPDRCCRVSPLPLQLWLARANPLQVERDAPDLGRSPPQRSPEEGAAWDIRARATGRVPKEERPVITGLIWNISSSSRPSRSTFGTLSAPWG